MGDHLHSSEQHEVLAMEYKFEIFSRIGLRGRRWYFRFVASNGETMAQSEDGVSP